MKLYQSALFSQTSEADVNSKVRGLRFEEGDQALQHSSSAKKKKSNVIPLINNVDLKASLLTTRDISLYPADIIMR